MPPLLAGELTTAQMGGQGSPHRDNFVSGKILLLIMKMFAAHATPFEQQLTPGHRTDEYSDAGSISVHRPPAASLQSWDPSPNFNSNPDLDRGRAPDCAIQFCLRLGSGLTISIEI